MKNYALLIPIVIFLSSCGPSDEEIAQERKYKAQQREHKRLMTLYDCRSYARASCTGNGLYRSCFDITVRHCMLDEGYPHVKMKEADPFFTPR